MQNQRNFTPLGYVGSRITVSIRSFFSILFPFGLRISLASFEINMKQYYIYKNIIFLVISIKLDRAISDHFRIRFVWEMKEKSDWIGDCTAVLNILPFDLHIIVSLIQILNNTIPRPLPYSFKNYYLWL